MGPCGTASLVLLEQTVEPLVLPSLSIKSSPLHGKRNTENKDKALPGCCWLLMLSKLAFYNDCLTYAFNYMHVASWFHWKPQNHVALCISPLILSLLPRAWDGRRSHQRKGNIFLEISISGPATSSHPILMAFQITEHHMSIRKPWSSQLSGASRDVTMKNGVPSSLFPTKATQSFWKTSQMRSFPMTQRMSLHRSPNPPRRFLMKFVMSSHQAFIKYIYVSDPTLLWFS